MTYRTLKRPNYSLYLVLILALVCVLLPVMAQRAHAADEALVIRLDMSSVAYLKPSENTTVKVEEVSGGSGNYSYSWYADDALYSSGKSSCTYSTGVAGCHKLQCVVRDKETRRTAFAYCNL